MEKILTSKRVLTDVEKLSSKYQTSTLEAFHSVILRFTPKNVVFPFIGMLCRYVHICWPATYIFLTLEQYRPKDMCRYLCCGDYVVVVWYCNQCSPMTVLLPHPIFSFRLYLAAMHFNENAGRCQAKTNSGRLRYKLSFPKAKKGAATVKAVKTQPTYCKL